MGMNQVLAKLTQKNFSFVESYKKGFIISSRIMEFLLMECLPIMLIPPVVGKHMRQV